MPVKYREELALKLCGLNLQTLEETPQRALKFRMGIGNHLVIRRLLQQRGYTQAVHDLGWKLLGALGDSSRAESEEQTWDPEVTKAVMELDPYDEELVEISKASMQGKFDDQMGYLLSGITPSTGMEAVLNVALFLRRADNLEEGKDRKSSRKQDQEAIKLLGVRGITPELRKRLAGLVRVANSAKPVEEIDEAGLRAKDEEYVKALVALRVWYEEWSRIARVVIKRRDHLILLGLAHRKSPTKAEPEEPETPGGG